MIKEAKLGFLNFELKYFAPKIELYIKLNLLKSYI